MNDSRPIYLDYQATTPIDPKVLDAMLPFFEEDFGNPHSSEHSLGWRAASAVEKSQQNIADLVGADSDEVIFTSGATESNNLAILGLGRGNKNKRRNRILVSSIEHKCVLSAARALQEQSGYLVDYLPVNNHGFIDLTYLENVISDDVLLASVMAVNNEIGTIQDMRTLASLTEKHGVILHTDAAQAPCAMDITELFDLADLVSLSGHKMYGPKGVGALILRRYLKDQLEPLIYGGGQQENLRSGTIPVALAIGMARAAELLSGDNSISERERVRSLAEQFVMLLSNSIKLTTNGPASLKRHPGNLNIQISGIDASDFLIRLQPRICASTGSACTSGIIEPSHVLKAIGLKSEQVDSSVRIGFGRFTTEEQIIQSVEIIKSTIDQAKN